MAGESSVEDVVVASKLVEGFAPGNLDESFSGMEINEDGVVELDSVELG